MYQPEISTNGKKIIFIYIYLSCAADAGKSCRYTECLSILDWHGFAKQHFIFYIFYFFSALYILTNGTVFSTETYINFTAVTKEFGPLEFIWQFADRPPERTTRRSIIKRFNLPNMYVSS